jgi:hypothetical protein
MLLVGRTTQMRLYTSFSLYLGARFSARTLQNKPIYQTIRIVFTKQALLLLNLGIDVCPPHQGHFPSDFI